VLPDASPIAVLCTRIEQATTDLNGAAGFAATAQPNSPPRIWRYTYNQHGQILTEDGPRTDLNDRTTYTYHSATAFSGSGAAASGVTQGDLKSITNAAGQTTTYDRYNPHGQLLQSTDPNGVITAYTYDLRQRLLSHSVGGQTTRYTYDPAGQLTRITAPDGSYIGHSYDAAQRHIASFDHLGNRIDYTLDNAGNRTGERVKDPSGKLRRQLTRSLDPLGRVQQTTGALH
jgi:YD repeat-containing protein